MIGSESNIQVWAIVGILLGMLVDRFLLGGESGAGRALICSIIGAVALVVLSKVIGVIYEILTTETKSDDTGEDTKHEQ